MDDDGEPAKGEERYESWVGGDQQVAKKENLVVDADVGLDVDVDVDVDGDALA